MLHATPDTAGVLRQMSLVLFGDGAPADSLAVPSTSGSFATPVADAGVGIRFQTHIGDLDVPLRLELPLWVSRPTLAQDTKQGINPWQFRWLFSVEKSF